MNLITTKKLFPIRNEKMEIYKWEEDTICLVPSNVQQVTFQQNLDKVVVKMTNGDTVVIEDKLAEFGKKFSNATANHIQVAQVGGSMHGFWFGLCIGAAGTCIGYLLSLVLTR